MECPICKETMVRWRNETPEGEYLFGWMCGCDEELRKRDADSPVLLQRGVISTTSNRQEPPESLAPVLAKIESCGCLSKGIHYEVVYYDCDNSQEWKSFSGSKTFDDGEIVLAWRYANECL